MNLETQRISPAPIRKSIRVKAAQGRAFEVFVGHMGQWWLKGHSLLKSPQMDVVVEPRDGGRWFEVGEDDSEQDWGRVLLWSPPSRVVLAWQLTADWASDPRSAYPRARSAARGWPQRSRCCIPQPW